MSVNRYHYNVANSRVEQHVEKGNDDGLYISSVACCQELWALIMDAGTGFSAQVPAGSGNMFMDMQEAAGAGCTSSTCLTCIHLQPHCHNLQQGPVAEISG